MELAQSTFQHHRIKNSVSLQSRLGQKSANEIYVDDKEVMLFIGNINNYIVGEKDGINKQGNRPKSWFTYVLFGGLFKLNIDTHEFKINMGLSLKSFYQNAVFSNSIRKHKTLRSIAGKKLISKYLEIVDIKFYPNIFALAKYYAEKNYNEPLIICCYGKDSFEGIYYRPELSYTEQIYALGKGYNTMANEIHAFDEGKSKNRIISAVIKSQLGKKLSYLMNQDSDAIVYLFKEEDVPEEYFQVFPKLILDRQLVRTYDDPQKMASIGLFQLNSDYAFDYATKVGISFSPDQTDFASAGFEEIY